MTTTSPCGLLEARLQRGGLAEVAAQADDADVVVRGVEPGERRERPVRRAVVHEDDLPGRPSGSSAASSSSCEERDAALLVVHGDDHRDHGR